MLDRSVEITVEDVVQELRRGGETLNREEVDIERAIKHFRSQAEGSSITFWYPTAFLAGLRKVDAKEGDFEKVDMALKLTLAILFDIFASILSFNFPLDTLTDVNGALLLIYGAQTMKLAQRRQEE